MFCLEDHLSISNVDIILSTEICFSHMGEQEELYYKDKPTAKEKRKCAFWLQISNLLAFHLVNPS